MKRLLLAKLNPGADNCVTVQDDGRRFLSPFALKWYQEIGFGTLVFCQTTGSSGVVFPWFFRDEEERHCFLSFLQTQSGLQTFIEEDKYLLFVPCSYDAQKTRLLHSKFSVETRYHAEQDKELFMTVPFHTLKENEESKCISERIARFSMYGYDKKEHEFEGNKCYPVLQTVQNKYGFILTNHFSHSSHSDENIAAAHAYHGNTEDVMLEKVKSLAKQLLMNPLLDFCSVHIGENTFGGDAHEMALFVPNQISFEMFRLIVRLFFEQTQNLAFVPDIPTKGEQQEAAAISVTPEQLLRSLRMLVGETGRHEHTCECDNTHIPTKTVCSYCHARNILKICESQPELAHTENK